MEEITEEGLLRIGFNFLDPTRKVYFIERTSRTYFIKYYATEWTFYITEGPLWDEVQIPLIEYKLKYIEQIIEVYKALSGIDLNQKPTI